MNYNYKNRILVEPNGRYDGSSKFPSNDRWAFFPSASAGWRISEEPFFEQLKSVINNAKIRASYGEIGNQEGGSDMYIQTIARSRSSVYWLGAGKIAGLIFLAGLLGVNPLSCAVLPHLRGLDGGACLSGFLHRIQYAVGKSLVVQRPDLEHHRATLHALDQVCRGQGFDFIE